jgi:hypothetical protein
MSVQLVLKNSSVQDKEATAAQLAVGELALNYHSSGPFLQCEDSAGNIWRLGGVVIASTAPSSPSRGAWWLDSDDDHLYFYDGSGWIEIQTGEIVPGDITEGTARQLLQTNAAGTATEWTSNIDVPGTLDVTGVATFDNNVVITGNLTVNGTTTTIDTTTLVVEDKNIEMGAVGTPTDSTADGGGITLKGATDKTINWVNATDAWTSSERFSVPLGAQGTPSLTFTGDANTGIYSPGADQVAISTNGSRRLLISDAQIQADTLFSVAMGGVGFQTIFRNGVNEDNYITHGASGFTSFRNHNGSEYMRLDSSGRLGLGTSAFPAYTAADNFVVNDSGNSGITIRSGTASLGTIAFSDATSGAGEYDGFVQYDQNTRKLVFGTASTDQVAITSTGAVGIGTTSPTAPLTIIGGSGANPTIRLAGGANDDNARIESKYHLYLMCNGDGNQSGRAVIFGNSSSEKARIDSSGRLLVGTSTSRGNNFNLAGQHMRLQVEGTGYRESGASFTSNSNTAGEGPHIVINRSRGTTVGSNTIVQDGDRLGLIAFQGNDGADFLVGAWIDCLVDGTPGTDDMPGRLVFSTTADGAQSPTERMRISANGNLTVDTNTFFVDAVNNRVGIGTTGPDATLDIRGDQDIRLGATAYHRIKSDTSGNFTINDNDVAERLRIDSSGRLGLGNSSPGSFYANKLVVDTGSAVQDGITIKTGTSAQAMIAFADGTSGSDRYSGYIDYNHGTNALTFGTNGGATRMIIDSSGRVGIGTTSPATPLHVSGTGQQTILLGSTDAGGAQLVLDGDANGDGNGGDYAYLWHTTDGDLRIANGKSGVIAFRGTSDAEKARIDSSGRLLVGTSTSRIVEDHAGNGPQGKIQIEGTNSDAIISIISAGTADANRSGTLSLGRHRNSTIGGTPTIVQNGDSLGAICFAGGDGTDMRTKAAKIVCQVDGTPGANDMPGRLVFSTTADGASSPTERMRITSSGNMLVGTTNSDPGGASSNGRVVINTANGGQAALTCYNLGTSAVNIISLENGNGQVGRIQVNGSATSYLTSSDYRLKENVVPLAGAADRIKQLKPSQFNFIADPSKILDGFLAHEAQAVVPECADGIKDEVDADGKPVYQGIDQSKLVPLLTAALQEALAEIESLKARVTALEP